MKKRIIIADDHIMISDGIAAMLKDNAEYEIVEVARTGYDTIEKTRKIEPDILILDISFPDILGTEVARLVKEISEEIRILVLTQYDNSEYIYQMLKSGADGYLLKNSGKDELITALRVISSGNKYFGKKICEIIVDNMPNEDTKGKNSESDNEKILLTKREKEIIKLIADDLSNYDIAEKLSLSIRTVETHRRNIMRKLDVKTVVALVRYAVANKIINI